MAFTTYLDNALLQHAVGKTAYTMPANYAALFTAAPTVAGGGTETAYTNYARVALSGDWGTISGNSISNSAAINFPSCGATGASIVAWGIYDAATGGNLLQFGTVTYTAASGNVPSFAVGALTSSLT